MTTEPRKPRSGTELIAHERFRQLLEEGYGFAHDAGYCNNELALAGAWYALPEAMRNGYRINHMSFWPWSGAAFKPSPDDRIRELTKAGALIAAEIDRLLHRGGSAPSMTPNGLTHREDSMVTLNAALRIADIEARAEIEAFAQSAGHGADGVRRFNLDSPGEDGRVARRAADYIDRRKAHLPYVMHREPDMPNLVWFTDR